MTTHATYMGYRTDDFEHPFAKFFNDMIASIPANVAAALEHALPSSEALDFEEVTKMANKGYDLVENGYFMLPDGGLHVPEPRPVAGGGSRRKLWAHGPNSVAPMTASTFSASRTSPCPPRRSAGWNWVRSRSPYLPSHH